MVNATDTPQIGSGRLLITYAEAAEALAVSPRYLRMLVYRGLLPAVRLGRLRRIALEDLTAFVEDLRDGVQARTQPTISWRAAELRSPLDDLRKGSFAGPRKSPVDV